MIGCYHFERLQLSLFECHGMQSTLLKLQQEQAQIAITTSKKWEKEII